jgi:hypothetical protein
MGRGDPEGDDVTPNVPLLRQTMDHILAHPDLHRQNAWAIRTDCGTAYCFAGWACALSGLRVDQRDFGRYDGRAVHVTDGRYIEIAARDLLGLDPLSAAHMFDADNTTADLKHYVDQIAEHGRIVEPVQR